MGQEAKTDTEHWQQILSHSCSVRGAAFVLGRHRWTATPGKHQVREGRLLVLWEKMKWSIGMVAKGGKQYCETTKYEQHNKHTFCDTTNQLTRNFWLNTYKSGTKSYKSNTVLLKVVKVLSSLSEKSEWQYAQDMTPLWSWSCFWPTFPFIFQLKWMKNTALESRKNAHLITLELSQLFTMDISSWGKYKSHAWQDSNFPLPLWDSYKNLSCYRT